LETLPAWDGNDHIRALASTVPTDNTAWSDHFYRWFLGLVAQWKQMNRTHGNSVVPLLVGSQGCGKSTWCRNLLPAELRAYYTDSIDFGSKRETEMALHRFALINLDEFDSIKLGQQPFLKHLLQKPDVNIRRPHKSSIIAEKRYGVFIATCNHFDLLSDPTGSRRFLCVEVDGRIGETGTFPLTQAYAQALAALRNGERYWFDKDEEALVIENNLQFQQIPVEEQLLLEYFTFTSEPDGDGEWLAAIEIINRLQKRSKIKIGEGRIRHFCRILNRHEVPMKRMKHGNTYGVKEI
jgi:predicted P-loop ATPase